MNIDKKQYKDAENETLFSLELYKNKTTGDLEYRSPKGVIIKVADKEGLETLEGTVTSLQSTVNALPAAPTTTVVNISSTETTYDDGRPLVASGILAMGSSPIELLPASGANKYYDIDKIVLEYTHNTTAYTSGAVFLYIDQDSSICTLSTDIITTSSNGFNKILVVGSANGVEGVAYSTRGGLNSNVTLRVWDSSNPTLGDGTLRAIITYTIRTFGA